MSISSREGVDDNSASLHAHAKERLERLRALLDRLEADGGPADPILDAVRSLLEEAERGGRND